MPSTGHRPFGRAPQRGAFAYAAALLLTACAHTTLAGRLATARAVAAPSGLTQETIPAGRFALAAFTRIGQRGRPAEIYIEGDGFAYLDRYTPSGDPTPKNPIGLRLAAADPAANVIYLARPCQYSGLLQDGACPQAFWTEARLAPEAIAALDAAIDDVKRRYDLPSFELNGYSGGGGAAVLLAARRHDITALRSVAGNIDTGAFDRLHSLTPSPAGLRPEDAAASLARLPQLHISGADDAIVPPSIAADYIRTSGTAHCARQVVAPGMTHDGDWAALWPGLRRERVGCN